jgi:hypothetical protein
MTTPLQPPDSTGYASALSRDWCVQVNLAFGTGAPDNWAWVFGLTKAGPTNQPNLVDDGDIYGGGYDSQIATAQAGSLVLEGIYKGPIVDDVITLPPSLLYLRGRGKEVGYKNLAQMRFWRADSIDIAEQVVGAVQWQDGTEDWRGLFQYTSTLVFRGKPTTITKPAAPETASSIHVNPTIATLEDEETIQLSAEDNNGADRTNDVVWTSGTPATATVDSYGRVTAHATGTSTITATLGVLTDTAAITVV